MALPPVLAGGSKVKVARALPAYAARFCGGPGMFAGSVKLAVALLAMFMVSVQVPVPVHSPLQPANAEPPDGVAVSVTSVPDAKPAEPVAPQLMPAGPLVTVPLP